LNSKKRKIVLIWNEF